MLENYATISFKEAGEFMESGQEYRLIDTREEHEYITGHAEGARLLPVGTITEESAAEKIPSKDTKVFVYCRSGKRAKLAMKKLRALGYRDVESLGSLVGWPYGITVEEEEYDF